MIPASRDHETWHDPEIAAYCDKYWRGIGEQLHRSNLRSFCRRNIQAGETVLEVGCGTGLIYEQLIPLKVGYTGVDIALPMLAIARRNFPNGFFMQGDAYDLPFADGVFDVAVCFEVLGHIPDIRTPIAEMLRVSRKVLFTVWPAEHGFDDLRELAEGVSGVALHRNYSHEYILNALPSDVTVIMMDRGYCRRYVVTKETA